MLFIVQVLATNITNFVMGPTTEQMVVWHLKNSHIPILLMIMMMPKMFLMNNVVFGVMALAMMAFIFRFMHY